MALDNPDRVERIYPKHCANCSHRENCAHLKVHDSCYVVDVTIKKETVKYQMMECNCNGVQETAERPACIKWTVLPESTGMRPEHQGNGSNAESLRDHQRTDRYQTECWYCFQYGAPSRGDRKSHREQFSTAFEQKSCCTM